MEEIYASKDEFDEDYMINNISTESNLKSGLEQLYPVQSILENDNLTPKQEAVYENIRKKMLNLQTCLDNPLKLDPQVIQTFMKLKNSSSILTSSIEKN